MPTGLRADGAGFGQERRRRRRLRRGGRRGSDRGARHAVHLRVPGRRGRFPAELPRPRARGDSRGYRAHAQKSGSRRSVSRGCSRAHAAAGGARTRRARALGEQQPVRDGRRASAPAGGGGGAVEAAEGGGGRVAGGAADGAVRVALRGLLAGSRPARRRRRRSSGLPRRHRRVGTLGGVPRGRRGTHGGGGWHGPRGCLPDLVSDATPLTGFVRHLGLLRRRAGGLQQAVPVRGRHPAGARGERAIRRGGWRLRRLRRRGRLPGRLRKRGWAQPVRRRLFSGARDARG